MMLGFMKRGMTMSTKQIVVLVVCLAMLPVLLGGGFLLSWMFVRNDLEESLNEQTAQIFEEAMSDPAEPEWDFEQSGIDTLPEGIPVISGPEELLNDEARARYEQLKKERNQSTNGTP